MDTKYAIEVSMKVLTDWLSYCTYEIGKDKANALRVFEQLEFEANGEGLLRLNLVETIYWKKVVASKTCTLTELEKNSRIITKEIFKMHNFEGV